MLVLILKTTQSIDGYISSIDCVVTSLRLCSIYYIGTVQIQIKLMFYTNNFIHPRV